MEVVFGGENVPHYEVNSRTVDLLCRLKEINEQRDRMAEIITEDFQQKAEEYKTEGETDSAFRWLVQFRHTHTARMDACTHAHTHTRMHGRTHTHTHTHTHGRMHGRTHTHTHTHTRQRFL